ncbi:hypothetical protein C900_03223 [Fulvivirga imtechensis AK7]|uniref:Co-chaperone DjlA N-terminal domain-containing protein n=1 Tax=Fulvivirga imtechensis AK7 TaxID=1237149 RepID=L8JQ18_9BACT|nr:hypothetical protein [Fulvivirga imtechensis]ELR70940.1 hypothetical protein C900_03223 [Fulvivirga imtechensis AK7]
MAKTKMDDLYTEYTQVRFLDINKEQFIYVAHLLPSCLIVMSDGLLDREEWVTLKRLSKILGSEFATEDLGTDEKEENLMLIYKAEIRYLLKNRDKWEAKFVAALRDFLAASEASKDFVRETMDLFASKEQDTDNIELQTYQRLKTALDL